MPNAQVAAAATGLLKSGYSLDDAVHDMLNLWRLLDIATETAIAIPRGAANNEEMARLDALVWIGRDLAKTIQSQLALLDGSPVAEPQTDGAKRHA